MNSKVIFYLFVINAILNIIALITGSDLLNYITKPLLMILLGWYVYQSTPRNGFTNMMLLGILFSVGGDTALMIQENPNFFIIGLLSFLIAHVYYIIGMYRFPGFKSGLLHQKWWLGLSLIIYGFCLVYILWSGLGEMKLPVTIYSTIIMLMGLSALNLFGRTNKATVQLFFIGALLFIFSDSVIAINKFGIDGLTIPFPSLITMTTYIIGQFLIAKATILSGNNMDNENISSY